MSLLEVWDASAANPYYPTVSKERQFLVGFSLLFTGMCWYHRVRSKQLSNVVLALVLTGLFGLSKFDTIKDETTS
jgi:hypothetical protein